MVQVVTPTARWTILVRSSGDALAVQAGGQGLDLGFLGTSASFTPPEIETWLTELIGVAGKTGSDSPVVWDPASSIPIPRTLHQALTGLLFYEAELWGGTEERHPCTVACLTGGTGIAFGWTGSARVEVLLDGRPFEPAWVLVRDQEGRSARAFVSDARLPLEARVIWPANGGEALPAEGEIEARWPGVPGEGPEGVTESQTAPPAESAAGASVESATEAVSSDDEPEPRPGRRRGFWHFRGWMERLSGQRARAGEEPEPIAHDVPGVPDLLPEPEVAVAEAPAAVEPTPEPAVEEAPAAVEATPEARVPLADVTPAVEREVPVDPFDLGALATLEPAPAVAEPAARTEPDLVAWIAPGRAIEQPVAQIEPELVPWIAPEPAVAEPAAQIEPEPAVAEPAWIEPEPVVEEPVAQIEPEPAVAEPPWIEPEPAVAEPEPQAMARQEDSAAGATGAGAVRVRQRTVARHPAWPEPEEPATSDTRPLWQRRWFVLAVVAVLFAAGWFLGRVDFSRAGRDIGSAFKAIGFGPARYEVTVASRPSGAWIAVDGVDQARRTPATLELKPGAHEVVLSFSGVGGSSHAVNGRRGQRVALDVELWGSLKVVVPGGGVPISVAVDGVHRGFAPLEVAQLQPGIHRLQFSGPGVAPWEQTVEVHVNRTVELLAQPIASPATGVLEVRATLADETGSEPLTGAQVWIDGQLSGVTPLKVELPRGPHSIRVRYRDEDGPVQVIDLPGGNLRYATIQLGLDPDAPRLEAALPERIPLDRSTVLSTSLDGAREGDVREMWLHVRTPEGAWRRYPMTLMKAPAGLVGVAVFPTVLFDARGRTAWYVSASTPMGDDYFTEMRAAQAAPGP